MRRIDRAVLFWYVSRKISSSERERCSFRARTGISRERESSLRKWPNSLWFQESGDFNKSKRELLLISRRNE